MSLVSSNGKPAVPPPDQRISIRFVPSSPVSIPVKPMAGTRTVPGCGNLTGKAKRMTFLAWQARLARRTAEIIAKAKESLQKETPPASCARPPSWQAKGRS